MRLRYAWGRVGRWLRPTLVVPVMPARPSPAVEEPVSVPLCDLFVDTGRRSVIVVTSRGVAFQLAKVRCMDIATFTRILAQIDRWPETPDRDAGAFA